MEFTEEIDSDDDIMTIKEWKECVEDGYFIDYDGMGQFSNGKKRNKQLIYPSEYLNGTLVIPPEATHVVWYNR